MTGSLLLLLPISVLMAALIGAAFWWAIFAGQFDDSGRAGRSILMDDDSTDAATTPHSSRTENHSAISSLPEPGGQDTRARSTAAGRTGQDSIPD